MRSWQQRLRDENTQWEELCGELRAKLDVALRRLVMISNGTHYEREVGATWNQTTKLATTAAEGLKAIALMPERRQP